MAGLHSLCTLYVPWSCVVSGCLCAQTMLACVGATVYMLSSFFTPSHVTISRVAVQVLVHSLAPLHEALPGQTKLLQGFALVGAACWRARPIVVAAIVMPATPM